ncbi:hypothetical protein Chor_013825 [Crotalus horridus]
MDTTKDPCQKIKCSRHKVCIAQGYQRAMCISRKKLEHRVRVRLYAALAKSRVSTVSQVPNFMPLKPSLPTSNQRTDIFGPIPLDDLEEVVGSCTF